MHCVAKGDDVAVQHETPKSLFVDARSLILDMSVQLTPSHCSAKVWTAAVLVKYPTATHDMLDTHDTLVRTFDVFDPAFGLATMVQLTPSQCSIRVCGCAPLE